MNLMLRCVTASLVLALGLGLVVEAGSATRKAKCLVCAVAHGESEEEEVRAVRTYQGKEYGFCSEKCAQAFVADPAAYVPADFPRPAPAFSLRDLGGKTISNASLEGKVVLLDFWATWCAPCRKSMPELQALHAKYSGRGFTVVGISIDEGAASKVKKFVQSKRITYPIAIDRDREPAWEAYRVKAVPAAYLLDREGRIVAQWTGVPADARELERKLEALLAAN